jgi:outer membrane receptor protein involved in Fe transport
VSLRNISVRSNGANIVPTVNAPKLEAYQKVDLKAFYQWGGAEIFAGINNLFNNYYTTSAYGSDFYPMPERHAYAGLTYTFPNSGD